ncbi:molybdopterin biosynthesis protein [Tissierella sp. Yu-01]|uniref:molybdopterin biosynthesis protein n=1 Tax=Tissierella sp. Yu-01 TaxID=3035694 RepID=UPI00240DB0EC|nr:molybdopterin biosynthesis protein [Tissierella sp. Yu-01]WFA08182.1 molybdopterin biosynthesis protein [Tissierella sp. Yu-01]
MDRNTYIDNIDVEVAKMKYFDKLKTKLYYEEVDVVESLNRVTFEPIFARISSPSYNASAMDGIAVISKNTDKASENNPLTLELDKDYMYVNTGNQIVDPYDAVIMIEDVIQLDDGKVQILKSVYPWQHIRQIGEDIVATEMIIPSKHKIRPIDLGALISGGIETLKVYKKPKVGILPTGSEIVENIDEVKDGKIIDSNSRVFEGMVKELGGIPNRYAPKIDDYELLKESILKGVEENDILLINAGSSAGTKDYTVKLIRELGEVVIHGVAMKPGKPTILGIIQDKPVIGIPGYPVSAFLAVDVFVKPLIQKYIGAEETQNLFVKAQSSKRIVSSLKNKELIRVNLGLVNGRLIATPISTGAGVSMSLVKADGIATIPRNSEGVEAGEMLDVELLKPFNHIKNSLVSIGSHDLIMDVIGDMHKITSSHVGSLGGIMALKRGECHLAPIHLLDMDTGEYNISYVKKYFPSQKMALIKGVQRQQGFIVKKGNPMNIKNFKDLTRDDIVYVNRQRGAGTRVLLDYHLGLNNIVTSGIRGYQRELNTHMAIATAVMTGSASTGLGVYSAAKAMNLDFIEVAYEDYDFLVTFELLEDDRIKKFIDVIKSDRFKNILESLGGYGFKNTGEIILID